MYSNLVEVKTPLTQEQPQLMAALPTILTDEELSHLPGSSATLRRGTIVEKGVAAGYRLPGIEK